MGGQNIIGRETGITMRDHPDHFRDTSVGRSIKPVLLSAFYVIATHNDNIVNE